MANLGDLVKTASRRHKEGPYPNGDHIVPKRPWSTNGKCLFDAFHQEIFSVGDNNTSLGISPLACTLEHICNCVNAAHDGAGGD